MMRKVELLTNLAILIFITVAGGAYLRDRFFSRTNTPRVKVGDSLPKLPGYEWTTHPRTLLLALQNGCHYCEDSSPDLPPVLGTVIM
jgi:hypothetical protein